MSESVQKGASNRRPRVLTFVNYYLPGFRSGGPCKSISNLVKSLGTEIDFLVVTADRDPIASEPHSRIRINDWNDIGQAKVFYLEPSVNSFNVIRRLLKYTEYDVLYLNSFVCPKYTFLPLLIRWIGLAPKRKVIIAPRGEFSPGALSLKATKKKLYSYFIKTLGICNDVLWQASSTIEKNDIANAMNISSINNFENHVMVAPPILDRITVAFDIVNSCEIPHKKERITPGARELKIVFLSRISRKKNLDFLLSLLGKMKKNCKLTIYGPIDDPKYWRECQELIRSLPLNVTVTYEGAIPHEQVHRAFATHDIFVFPTLGENFGHVILESLRAGTPLILSDQTMWTADEHGAVEVLSLNDPAAWVSAIDRLFSLTEEQIVMKSDAAIGYARKYLSQDITVQAHRKMFTQFAQGIRFDDKPAQDRP